MSSCTAITPPDGSTRLFLIVGDPIVQVKSPAGITRGLAERGQNAILMPAHVAPADLAAFLDGAGRIQNLDGIIATMPHKFAVAGCCASLTGRAERLGAVNVMRRLQGGGWHGDMLDGVGLVEAIRSRGGEPRGKRALLVGAGGAGSAIGLALLDNGVAELAIHDADQGRRDALVARLTGASAARVGPATADPHGFHLVVNATPAGMRAGDTPPIDVGRLEPSAFAACVITVPLPSPWLAAARAKGCRTSDGVDMFEAEQGLLVDFLLGVDVE